MMNTKQLRQFETAIKLTTWKLQPMRTREFNALIDACIDGDMRLLSNLLTRHGVSDVTAFRNDMLRLLNEVK